ncbi:hypothetical protein CPHO_03315 [Corynebacterium phocae]|uniref:Cutinase n=1 Tax=Corynebacterium phocae TaxID=161895 RepID=A0A1L7D6M2_9CORY|nr:hypothetical protein CPHO_03315 [Corynebacterium phocae]KAA8726541.1 hypothetical protein F4V58_02865 [Corynebacterium phocae]
MAVVAARGSDQNAAQGEYLGPQTYGTRTSNGYEGRNFISFFHFVDSRHPGLMDKVQVIGLDEEQYPAAMNVPPLAKEGEVLSFGQVLERMHFIVTHYSLGQMAWGTTFGLLDSLRRGEENAPGVVAEYERRTGCKPRYIVAGYSQGAIVATSLEKPLAAQGKLHGAFYLGNPLHRPAGMSVWYPHQLAPLPPHARIDYCLAGDFSCTLTPENALLALRDKAKLHASYFQDAAAGNPTAQDIAVADRFASLIRG